jgi:hypothetical protein
MNNANKKFTKTFDLSQIAEDPMDTYLDTLGLWKKRIARDGSCLFRAVAEQVIKQQSEKIFFLFELLIYCFTFARFIRANSTTKKCDSNASNTCLRIETNMPK